MGKDDAPDPPDYAAAAREEAKGSRQVTEQQTWANRPDQITPEGSVRWENTLQYDPSTEQNLNRWTQTTELNPVAQQAYDSQNRIKQKMSNIAEGFTGRVEDEFADRVNFDDFDPMGERVEANTYTPEDLQRSLNFGEYDVDSSQKYRQDAFDAIYDQGASRLNPRFEAQQREQQSRLYAQGLREGDKAYDEQMRKFGETQNDAYGSLANQATMGSGAEAERMFGMDAKNRAQRTGEIGQQASFYNQAANAAMQQKLAGGQAEYDEEMRSSNYDSKRRIAQITEIMQERGFSLNEMNAILYGNQINIPNMPGFNTASRAEGPKLLDAASMQFQSDMDATSMNNANTSAMVKGVTDMGGMAMMSDRRLKKNITAIGKLAGYPMYLFQYIWGDWSVGVMSDEIDPAFVIKHESGYDMVNYGELLKCQ